MFEQLFTPRAIQRVLAITVVTGTLTLAALALAALYLVVLLIKTVVDCVLQIITTLAEALTVGGPFVRLLFVFLLLFLAWKAAPSILAYIRREASRVSPLFFATGNQSQDEDDEQPGTIYGSVAHQDGDEEEEPTVQAEQAQDEHSKTAGSPFALTDEENGTARRTVPAQRKPADRGGFLIPLQGFSLRPGYTGS